MKDTNSNRHQIDIAELRSWLRGIEFHDEDGIAELKLFFKIMDEDEKMKRIFKELTKSDIIEILSAFVTTNCSPCEDFDDDRRGLGSWGNSGFDVSSFWDNHRQGIVLSAAFRTRQRRFHPSDANHSTPFRDTFDAPDPTQVYIYIRRVQRC